MENTVISGDGNSEPSKEVLRVDWSFLKNLSKVTRTKVISSKKEIKTLCSGNSKAIDLAKGVISGLDELLVLLNGIDSELATKSGEVTSQQTEYLDYLKVNSQLTDVDLSMGLLISNGKNAIQRAKG